MIHDLMPDVVVVCIPILIWALSMEPRLCEFVLEKLHLLCKLPIDLEQADDVLFLLF